MVSKCIPRKVMEVAGPSILIGVLLRSHSDNIELRLKFHRGDVVNYGHCTYSRGSSELPRRDD